jgi:hypothetical protein
MSSVAKYLSVGGMFLKKEEEEEGRINKLSYQLHFLLMFYRFSDN